MKLVKLAWRNIWRNRRRSLITMSSIVFAVVLVTAADSLQNGTYDLMEEVSVRLYTGDLQIQRTGFREDRSLSLSLEEGEQAWDTVLDDTPWVEVYSRRLSNFGLVSSDSTSTGSMIIGLEADREAQVSSFTRNIIDGQPLDPEDSSGVVIGSALAKNLGVSIADTIVVISQGYQGTMSYDSYSVRGIIRTGSVELDRALMLMNLSAAQELFWMHDRFTELVVRTTDFRSAVSHAQSLGELFGPDRYDVLDWETLLPELKQARAFDDIGNGVFYLFLFLVIGFEIFNTASMSVLERTREFGVLQAIGMKPIQISQLVFLELVMKIAIALLTGLLLAGILLMIFGGTVIPLSAELTEMYSEMGFTMSGIQFSTKPGVFIFPVVSVSLITFVAIAYPVYRAYCFRPVEALRHT